MSQESKTIEQDILIAAGCLSLFGWEHELVEGLDMLKCPFCFRQCALLNYQNIAKQREIQQQDKGECQENEENDNEQNSQIDKDKVVSLDLMFDAELEHRWYCAWITGDGKSKVNKTAEELTKKKPGWHITLEGIIRSCIPFDPEKGSDAQLVQIKYYCFVLYCDLSLLTFNLFYIRLMFE
jgi:hypothetical protein